MQHETAVTSFETELLSELVDRKRDCLQRLHALGRRQLELIDVNDEVNQLMPLLAEKQRLVGDLARIEHRLDPFRAQDPEGRTWRCAADRQRCAETVANCRALFAEILAQEKCAETRLNQQRGFMAVRLCEARQARQARAAYASRPELMNRLDLSSDR
jgi:hypothetical protein